MPWLRVIFLVTVLTVTSGYRWRCYFACVDQTGTQNDYVEQRDRCREYAQLKVDMASRDAGVGSDEKARKGQLVSLFSQCMANNGWTVPDGKSDKDKNPAAAAMPVPAAPGLPAVPPPPSPAAIAAAQARDKSLMSRSAECAFARQAADVSTNSAARAKACDIECENALKASPDSPRPASCRADLPPRLAKGTEK